MQLKGYGHTRRATRSQCLGIELEVDRSRADNAPDVDRDLLLTKLDDPALEVLGLEAKTDGSLSDRGVEIVTSPLKVKNWHTSPAYKDALKVLLGHVLECGYRPYESGSCGLHVHIGKPSAESILKIDQLLMSSFTFFKSFSGRSGYSYCQFFKPYQNRSERRRALNITPERTIEYRLFRGTAEQGRFFASIDAALALTEFCSIAGTRPVLTSWLVWLIDNAAKYSAINNYLPTEQDRDCGRIYQQVKNNLEAYRVAGADWSKKCEFSGVAPQLARYAQGDVFAEIGAERNNKRLYRQIQFKDLSDRQVPVFRTVKDLLRYSQNVEHAEDLLAGIGKEITRVIELLPHDLQAEALEGFRPKPENWQTGDDVNPADLPPLVMSAEPSTFLPLCLTSLTFDELLNWYDALMEVYQVKTWRPDSRNFYSSENYQAARVLYRTRLQDWAYRVANILIQRDEYIPKNVQRGLEIIYFSLCGYIDEGRAHSIDVAFKGKFYDWQASVWEGGAEPLGIGRNREQRRAEQLALSAPVEVIPEQAQQTEQSRDDLERHAD